MQYGFADGLQICVFWLENGLDIGTAMVMVILFYTFFYIILYVVFQVSLYIYMYNCHYVSTYNAFHGTTRFYKISRPRDFSDLLFTRLSCIVLVRYIIVVRQFLRYTRKILNKVCSSFGSECNE